jgi:hypothetical protein
MALTSDQSALLIRVLSDFLQLKVSIGLFEIQPLLAAAKEAAKTITSSRATKVESVLAWLRTDPVAHAVLTEALSKAEQLVREHNPGPHKAAPGEVPAPAPAPADPNSPV